MERYIQLQEKPELELGTQYFKNQLIDGNYFDIIFINDGGFLTSILFPLEVKHEAELLFFEKLGLSKRELEIMSLIVRGKTNPEIAKLLYISIATVKTHLNHIYKKLPTGEISPDRKTTSKGLESEGD